MCTLGGYIGNQDAAPVLLAMAKQQEGLWGSFYSGLATVAGGKLYWDKIVGNLSKLEQTTSVRSFPGQIGLVHSRTRSGGDREWAHPFLDMSGTIASVSQGCHGYFGDHTARIMLGNELLANNYRFRSAVFDKTGGYSMLADKSYVHSAEITVVAVGMEYQKDPEPVRAIQNVANRIPDEGVSIFMFTKHPGSLFVANINQRLVIGQNNTGCYLATSALALPEKLLWRAEMPSNTIAVVNCGTLTLQRLFFSPSMTVDESYPAGIEASVLAYVTVHPGCKLADIVDDAIKPLFPRDKLVRVVAAGYQVVERLAGSGHIRHAIQYLPGINNTEQMPQKVFFRNN